MSDELAPPENMISIDESSLRNMSIHLNNFLADPDNSAKKALAKIWLKTLDCYIPVKE